VIGEGDPSAMATQYLGLLWEDLMVNLLLGVASRPGQDEIEHRAARATAAFLGLHGKPKGGKWPTAGVSTGKRA
jgi:hypothetical protein